MTTGAIYARVSTGRQEQERTIRSQLEALRTRAQALAWDVPDRFVFTDDGWTGSRMDRPALDSLRDAAADGLLECVLVYDPDRLARSFFHQQLLLEEFQKRGVRVEFLQRPITEKPEDRLLVQMQGVFAEYERTKILERTRRGRLHKARTGGSIPWWVAPYGYRFVVGPDRIRRAEIEPVEAEWVRQAYAWVLEESLSARQVAKRLNARGVKPRKARLWTAGMSYRMLTNPTYTGTAYYNQRTTVEPQRRRQPGQYTKTAKSTKKFKPKEQWIPFAVPAQVTAENQARVRERLAQNKWTSPRNTKRQYLLRTLVTCADCGWRMNALAQHGAREGRKEYLYYQCNVRDTVDTGHAQKCHAKRVRADRLDAVVWDALTEWLRTPQVLQAELETLQDVPAGTADPEARESERLRATIQGWDRQVERLVDAYQSGAIEVDQLKTRRADLEARAATARTRLQDLELLRHRRVKVDQLVADVDDFAAALRAGLDAMPFEDRQRLVRLLVERVVVKDGDVTIEHVVPLSGRFSGLRLHHRRGPRVRVPVSRIKAHGFAPAGRDPGRAFLRPTPVEGGAQFPRRPLRSPL